MATCLTLRLLRMSLRDLRGVPVLRIHVKNFLFHFTHKLATSRCFTSSLTIRKSLLALCPLWYFEGYGVPLGVLVILELGVP
jgi:hypothetical protein